MNGEADKPIWERLREQLERMAAATGAGADPQARARKLAERAKLARRQAASGPTGPLLHFLAFTKGRERYGIPLEHVVEVQALEQYSPVPGAPAALRGVVHWRGAVLALLDLSRLFEVAETGLSDVHGYIVVEAAGKRLALAAALVDDILSVSHDHLRAAPELPGKVAPEWVIGVYDENRLILRMDEIVRHLERSREP